ncbi:hypothetical protein [Pseudobacter ginsenosidimutans]|uniref:Uncharacterized protein n=1 Tax=Pseudobacter ginsenosidimutans TaxID=661488 RepID=A0A4Q7MLK9_9BACT|nr:hypothetical protein [Pseudobacter ginsenosidimutans]QEC40190.1 hypothetical protein FSB84_00185 [Pseudobacter ginsenosidimutans]RZS69214.1 hypothetical protein EV199_5048 [Pseudobacter ginsenosidimutans]
MKIQKRTGVLLSLVLITVIITVCNNKPKTATPSSGLIVPVELPVIVPGFNFPEDSNTIYSWLNNPAMPDKYDSVSVYKHGWGIWAGLTAKTDQVYGGDTLLAYQTWLGVTEVQTQIVNGSKACDASAKTMRAVLSRPHQFGHHLSPIERAQLLQVQEDSVTKHAQFMVTVSYDPNAACYAIKNQILKQSVLNTYAKAGGIGAIPPFPQKAITIKPSYYIAEASDGLVRIPVWPGQPSKLEAFGPDKWNNYVYVDMSNKQQPNKPLVPVKINTTSPDSIANATVNLNDFIHFSIDEQMASHINKSDSTEGVQGKHRAKAGEVAILVCMHVATKEISNWTWQTYYWAPNPATPFAPSSNVVASLRPSQLQGAASHYAMQTAYAMVLPNQPITGGTNVGVQPLLTYNPYLEAGFHGTAPEPRADFQLPSVLLPGPQFGIQTNCMSCHAMATQSNAPGYTTDMYISMNDTALFNNQVQLDFAWSVQGNMILDAGATAAKK